MTVTNTSNTINRPTISIVVATHDQSEELQRNLPSLLNTQYAPGFEVIVVDESSTDQTEEVLNQLKEQYPHLYTTYIPSSSHYVSRCKLALTIGVKAAKHEWIVFTEANCHPTSATWLDKLVKSMTAETDVVCGYTVFEKGTKAHYSYMRMLTFWRQGKHPYRYDGACLAIRKTAFMQRNGFLKNLRFLRGEYDFLVNETDWKRIAVMNTPESRIEQEEPSVKSWTNQQLYYMQTRSHLKRTFFPRFLFVLHQLLIHILYIGMIIAIGLSFLNHNIIAIIISASCLLILLGIHAFLCLLLTKKYGEHIAFWKLPALDIGILWHYVYYRLRYMMSDKYDFTRK